MQTRLWEECEGERLMDHFMRFTPGASMLWHTEHCHDMRVFWGVVHHVRDCCCRLVCLLLLDLWILSFSLGCDVGILCHVTRLIHGCHVTRFHMWHDSFIRVTWLIPLQVNSRYQAAVNLQQQVVFQWRQFRKSIKWVMTNIHRSLVTHMKESCHTYEWVMSHIWMKMMMIALIITLEEIM